MVCTSVVWRNLAEELPRVTSAESAVCRTLEALAVATVLVTQILVTQNLLAVMAAQMPACSCLHILHHCRPEPGRLESYSATKAREL
mmetsp:Transcript_20207/g.48507  ORF Transcript_20207/g.48507 Transcript_20207/m.48507 type:complete len:87 (+) Transcript_20207:652-912(+)